MVGVVGYLVAAALELRQMMWCRGGGGGGGGV